MSNKLLTGKVIKKSSSKTIKVIIKVIKKHDVYKKYINRHQSFLVHDEHEKANVNDVVNIIYSRPFSKNKSWRLVNVVKD